VLGAASLRAGDRAGVARCPDGESQALREEQEARSNHMRRMHTHPKCLAGEWDDRRRNAGTGRSITKLRALHSCAPGEPVDRRFIHAGPLCIPRGALWLWRRVQSREGQFRGLGSVNEPFWERPPLRQSGSLSALAEELTTGRER
jgi:hypothetical protein